MSDDSDTLQRKVDACEQDIAALKRTLRPIRRRSATYLLGLPLYDIAIGPDLASQERRGHARGIIAIGDIATGVLAIGGVARGLIALGGVALGALTFGGCSIGLLFGFGGLGVGVLAVGGVAAGLIAVGGVAVGLVAVGGFACGYYACGGAALGQYTISAMASDPEAIRFFDSWFPMLGRWIGLPGG
jgi:hypothetical protein